MPYKIVKKTIYSKATGSWKKKQTCKTIKNAKKALKLLRGIEARTLVPRKRKK